MSNKIYNQEKIYGGNFALNIFDGTKIGSVITYSGDDIPDGFLECDGSDVSRTDYKALFEVIGTKFGEGDGSTTFTLPNITDITDPKMHYLIKWNIEGSMLNYATKEKSGFVRFATDPEAEYSVREDVAINAKQLKLAVPKTDLRNRIYGTDENGRQTHYNVEELIVSKIIDLTSTITGTLSAEELQMLKDNKNNSLRRNNIVFHYTSILDGKLRYSTVNKFNDGKDYLYTVLVDETTGDWEFSYKEVIEKYIADVPPTMLTLPSGLSGQAWYQVKNNMVSIQLDGVTASTSNSIYLISSFPSYLLPDKTKQFCTTASCFNYSNINAFFYANPTGLRLKAYSVGSDYPYWGTISYMLWER